MNQAPQPLKTPPIPASVSKYMSQIGRKKEQTLVPQAASKTKPVSAYYSAAPSVLFRRFLRRSAFFSVVRRRYRGSNSRGRGRRDAHLRFIDKFASLRPAAIELDPGERTGLIVNSHPAGDFLIRRPHGSGVPFRLLHDANDEIGDQGAVLIEKLQRRLPLGFWHERHVNRRADDRVDDVRLGNVNGPDRLRRGDQGRNADFQCDRLTGLRMNDYRIGGGAEISAR